MKEDRKEGRKGKGGRISERRLTGEAQENTRTHKFQKKQIFIKNNISIFSLHPFFYRVEESEKEKNRRSRFTVTEDEAVMDDVSVRSRSPSCRFSIPRQTVLECVAFPDVEEIVEKPSDLGRT